MSVYVDDMRASFRRMVMCHMLADTIDELHEMADRIGVARKWFQGPHNGHRTPHYDICQSKRAMAVGHGAKQIGYGTDEWCEIMKRNRAADAEKAREA